MDHTIEWNRLLSEAVSLCDRGSFREALGPLERIVAWDPANYTALFYFALSLLETEQSERSLQYWKKLRRMGTSKKNILLNMGCAYQNLGREGLAIRCFKRELEINPSSGESSYNLGVLYHNAHKYNEAIKYLERCFALKHSVESIVDRLADCYFRLGLPEKEKSLYEEWLKHNPNDVWCLNNLGAVLMQTEEYSRAEMYLKRAARVEPKDEVVLRNLDTVKLIRKGSPE
jgi:tetratricopeptide (TPR) repeat protein